MINYLGARILAETKMQEEYKQTFGYKYGDYLLDDELVIMKILNVKKDYYKVVKNILENEFSLNHKRGGRKPKLSIDDKLSATITFYSTKTTYLELAKKYGIHESNMYDNIKWITDVLVNKKIAKIIEDNKRNILGLYYKKIDTLIKK